ncbi:thaumatin family protein [Actinoplanes sp. NPDC049548]|uniref:thaumatin family protein n=1 Tax=Actinoplanes sp. NPDC049548 TaxID=3155152 RepID=UPI003418B8CA
MTNSPASVASSAPAPSNPAAKTAPATKAAAPGTTADPSGSHTVTFVNRTGEKVWIGNAVNPDGSIPITGLPVLEPGASGTITIPEDGGAKQWSGRFFARQGCTGTPGTNFHCEIGDCGKFADRCEIQYGQPASFAEFGFYPGDTTYGKNWYNVSYVNAVNFPITIDPVNAVKSPYGGAKECSQAGCPTKLLAACPAADLRSGGRLCLNSNPDSADTDYTRKIKAACPRAYTWSKDGEADNTSPAYNCTTCTGFTVTFLSK